MQQTIAFFDFDGTITTRDTLLEFIKFSKGKTRFYFGFLLGSPWLLALKLHLISNQRAKEHIFAHFFRHTPLADFQSCCDRFASEALPALIRPKALREFDRLRAIDADIAIVSASPENWLKSWAEKNGASLIATRLQIQADRLTGRIEGRNCHGTEKVARIREKYSLDGYGHILSYGDSSGDRPMLALGTNAFYKPFR